MQYYEYLDKDNIAPIESVIESVIEPVIEPVITIKKKRVFNEALREVFNKGRADYHAKRKARQIANQEIQEQYRLDRLKLYEDNIRKKALAIIKREIKEEYRLSQIEDDNTPDLEIHKMRNELQKPKAKPQTPLQPSHGFVFV